ncbi:zf-HC2 domain-containing protein, partial [candidate division FCPU426 bacterium]|nr:zf-HC2 domain-containing protein [candidate division FCPU426 bacterium]
MYWRRQMTDALDSAISARARQRLDLHLQICPSCGQAYHWQKTVKEMLRQG